MVVFCLLRALLFLAGAGSRGTVDGSLRFRPSQGNLNKKFPCETQHGQADCSKLPTVLALGAISLRSSAELMGFNMTRSAIRYRLAKPMPTARISCFRGKAESFKATPIVRSVALMKMATRITTIQRTRSPIMQMVSARVKPPSVSSMNMY